MLSVVLEMVDGELDRLHERIAGRFARAEPRARVRKYVSGAAAITRIQLDVEAALPGAAPEDVADAAVAAGQQISVMPARIGRIDRALARRGIDWSWPELARLDPGRSDTPADADYLAYTAVQMLLSGGAGLDMATVGSFARAMAPAGGVAPIAGQIEYRWPISPAEERDAAPGDDDLQTVLGDGAHQVPGARTALGHTYGGGSQYFSMWVVSSEP